MAELMLRQSYTLEALKRKMPLDEIRAGRLKSAVQIVDHQEPLQRVFFYLLLIWELADLGRTVEATELLERLCEMSLPVLSHHQSRAAVQLLSITAGVSRDKLKPIHTAFGIRTRESTL